MSIRRSEFRQTGSARFEIALEAALYRLELETSISALLIGALERVAHGPYGRCMRCSGTIAAVRLRALPWVRLCATCQDAEDIPGQAHPQVAPSRR